MHGYTLGRERSPWVLGRLVHCGVTIESGAEGAPFVAFGSTPPGTAVLYGSAGTGGTRYADGARIADDTAAFWTAGGKVRLSSSRPGAWFAVSIPSALLAIERPSGPVRAPSARLDRIRALVAEALALPAAGPGGGLDRREEIVKALVAEARAAIGAAARRRGGRIRPERPSLLASLEELLANRISEPLYVEDLSAATGLPERTLRHLLVEQCGVSPMRLVRNLRLCALREALKRQADRPGAVTAATAGVGLVHRGDVSAAYRELFGELPSETLRGGAS